MLVANVCNVHVCTNELWLSSSMKRYIVYLQNNIFLKKRKICLFFVGWIFMFGKRKLHLIICYSFSVSFLWVCNMRSLWCGLAANFKPFFGKKKKNEKRLPIKVKKLVSEWRKEKIAEKLVHTWVNLNFDDIPSYDLPYNCRWSEISPNKCW